MSLGLDDVYRIAELAHVGINEEAAQRMQAELNDIFKMIERIQAVDTEGVEPMMHPHDGVQRLREDKVVFGNNREENMKNAPEEFEGLFLVPQVIE
ncbi:MAG TPA: Asp-tRNA(Asn)/Glu-tRNA(Gln) amidotransferase subunit GatC [Candidatus Duodenibacillus intestinavium]|jgi:aspartyl-tRNA(Asn)/glutamyl-tRNA(Gln) amidotransferase subunit C|uniref:Asp-tRNA(Asn)/Glu-tRNA(Gln) amidotransferase subunit GatC n=1 Tax=Sutterella sp. AM11-39 TaxID=2292075 RepID=UPI000E50991D|nr:Asp-tRNA(Asn)/Glu-tRNA(Gln) amidotransferase subunit GatC [Sutterella sp. AM11-39]RHJ32894.1 Asp-tRNA(Asn)/Glu-tRNA(Gln) amidotransferase subunit GatC [Sutterella sp. AM11-39]HJA10915.1 Asp-tRNA(Asn)/Glu-tRNA(Gln) amidotransferase subunit GatC [Candidatus Duodenibacillus intestinavium]